MQVGIHPVNRSVFRGSGLGSRYFRTSPICWINMPCGWRDSDLRQLPTSQHWHTEDMQISRLLQLNAVNTGTIWFRSQLNLAKLNNLDCSGSSKIQPASTVGVLVLYLDSKLSMKQCIVKLALSPPLSLSEIFGKTATEKWFTEKTATVKTSTTKISPQKIGPPNIQWCKKNVYLK